MSQTRNPVFEDARPWFSVFVTGNADFVPRGAWAHHPDPNRALEVPEFVPVVAYLDAVLCRRKGTHQISLTCRGEPTGIDLAVKAYAAARGIPCMPIGIERDRWPELPKFRRDAWAVIRADAVIWCGPRESDGDPAAIAQLLGVNLRFVMSSPLE